MMALQEVGISNGGLRLDLTSVSFVRCFQIIDGIECYFATPSRGSAEDKVLLFLTNVYGAHYVNNQVCCA